MVATQVCVVHGRVTCLVSHIPLSQAASASHKPLVSSLCYTATYAMDAAVSQSMHGALPIPASSHHRALHHLKPPSSSAKQPQQQQLPPPRARLAVATACPSSSRRRAVAGAAAAAAAASVTVTPFVRKQHGCSSSRAATGYAAALADASLRAGALPRAARHARALLTSGVDVVAEDARVVALVRMLVAKGKAAMIADVIAEFVAICDRLLLPAGSTAAASY
ncbi:hypothetical protein GUJ93_ZPchr0006g41633 [Zizania palustris]|uniref:Uncharacterized protein n=1 Tax=Zizania palustris TaxID=103762 RepID=A0A8J5T7A5_ZIZPA|nr:hypothetical protein GUJ93_ZPchr0006g41633 [Zizania palustris]